MTEDKLYNSVIFDNYIKFLAARYPLLDIEQILKVADMERYELSDPGVWYTQSQSDRFQDEAVRLTGNLDLAVDAGTFIASPESMGLIKQSLITFAGPRKAFGGLGKLVSKMIKSGYFQVRTLEACSVELIYHVNPGVEEKDYQCGNRLGHLRGIMGIFGYEAKVEHPECKFNGGSICRYIVTWQKNKSETFKIVRNLVVIASLAIGATSFIINSEVTRLYVWPALTLLVLLATWFAERCENLERKDLLSNMSEPTDRLLQQINENHNKALIVNEVGEAMSNQLEVGGIVISALKVLEQKLGYDCCLVLLADDRMKLSYCEGYGLSPEQEKKLAGKKLPLSGSSADALLSTTFHTKKPLLAGAMDEMASLFPDHITGISALIAVESLMVCPIVCDGRSIGVLLVGNRTKNRNLLQSDLSLIKGIAPLLGISIRNAELLKTKERQFQAIVQLEKTMAELAESKLMSERYAEELHSMNEEVRNFAYIVSHDLRAPLVNIRGFAVELHQGINDIERLMVPLEEHLSPKDAKILKLAFSEDIPEALKFIDCSVTKMGSLIDAILKLSRMGHKELVPEPVDAKEMAESILNTITHQLKERSVEVTVGDLPVVIADKSGLDQVMRNLLDNAVKYLDKDRPGKIDITAEHKGHDIIFAVKDNGRGIAEDDMGKVFEIFRRAGKQDMPGEGMGLAYVRTLVRRLGGRIWCESTLGVGTTFFFTIPATEKADNIAEPEAFGD